MAAPDHDVSGLILPGIDPSRKERWVRYVLGEIPYLMYLHGLTPMEALTVTVCSTPEGDSIGSAALLINRISGKRITPKTVYTHLYTARAKGIEPWDHPLLKGEGNENRSTVGSENRVPYRPPEDSVLEALVKATERLDCELTDKAAPGRGGLPRLTDYDEYRCAAIAICYPAVAADEACDVQASAFLDAWIAYDLRRGFIVPEDGGTPDPIRPQWYRNALRRLKSRDVDVFDDEERARWRAFVTGPLPSVTEIGITL